MKKTLAVLGIMAMCSASSAFAMDDMMDKDHMKMMCQKEFKMMDTNGDGMMSKEEYMSAMEKKFMNADTSNKGMVTEQQMMDAHMKEMKDMGMMKDDKMMMKQ
jgi:hypothetical protein